ncbi:MAG: Rrf2 family transcriptional regulator [Pseudomonadota bacterium]
MKRNSRLSLALHALGHMAYDAEHAQTSTEIAAHAGTNPVVVRRVLGKLRKAGLLTSERGHFGGWRLARAPQNITLADVYLALEERLISTSVDINPHQCSIEHALHDRVSEIMQDVETSLLERLANTTIEDVRQAAE